MNKSFVFVLTQFALLFTIAVYCGVWGSWWQNTVTMAAIALGVWAVVTMRFSVNVLPTVRQKQQLFTGGPYKYIRHPMYSSLLLATGAWVFNRLSVVAVALWVALLVDLLIKLHYEETLLKAHFADYKAYTKRSNKLLPYIY